jgi:hypothetical protein
MTSAPGLRVYLLVANTLNKSARLLKLITISSVLHKQRCTRFGLLCFRVCLTVSVASVLHKQRCTRFGLLCFRVCLTVSVEARAISVAVIARVSIAAVTQPVEVRFATGNGPLQGVLNET